MDFTAKNISKPVYAVACTGHVVFSRIQNFDEGKAREEIRKYFEKLVLSYSVVLYTCMADGADMLFAEEAVACGIRTVAVLPKPVAEYAGEHVDKVRWERMFGQATATVETTGYEKASEYLLSHCRELLAVWDGKELPLFDEEGKPINRGGTYDTVRLAKKTGIKIQFFM